MTSSGENGPIVLFNFQGRDVRTVVIDGEPHWVGKDVCDLLGYADHTNAMKLHCKGVVKRHPLSTAIRSHRCGVQNLRPIPDILGHIQDYCRLSKVMS
ncbi:BRO-N domain-containing protein [Robbsia andropogonis]|uniref:BRO-N domain-containing protein n=1 Tax=Robbsia andropogonis TaxID=28092 RepID=UPI003D2630C3